MTKKVSSKKVSQKRKNDEGSPACLALKNRETLALHKGAAQLYMSLFSQNFTGDQILDLARPEKQSNQTVLERLVIAELADSLTDKDSRRFVLTFLNKNPNMLQAGDDNLNRGEVDNSNGTMLEEWLDAAIDGEIVN